MGAANRLPNAFRFCPNNCLEFDRIRIRLVSWAAAHGSFQVNPTNSRYAFTGSSTKVAVRDGCRDDAFFRIAGVSWGSISHQSPVGK